MMKSYSFKLILDVPSLTQEHCQLYCESFADVVELIAPTTCFLSKYIQLNSLVPENQQHTASPTEWIISTEEAFDLIPEEIETLYIRHSACFSLLHFEIISLPHLASLRLCNETLPHCTSFCIESLPTLTYLGIGHYCCTNQKAGKNPRIEGCCRIAKCPSLLKMELESHSFEYFLSLEINQLPSLQQIKTGTNCFQNIPKVIIRGMLLFVYYSIFQ